MNKPKKTEPMSFRLDPAVKAKLQRLADREHRSLTNFIESRLYKIVDEEAGQHG